MSESWRGHSCLPRRDSSRRLAWCAGGERPDESGRGRLRVRATSGGSRHFLQLRISPADFRSSETRRGELLLIVSGAAPSRKRYTMESREIRMSLPTNVALRSTKGNPESPALARASTDRPSSNTSHTRPDSAPDDPQRSWVCGCRGTRRDRSPTACRRRSPSRPDTSARRQSRAR